MHFFDTKNTKDIDAFLDWVLNQEEYPIEFYLDGVVYTLKDEQQKLFFCVGAEAIYNIFGGFYENL